MNIKPNYHVHKYDTRGSHDPHVSRCTPLYQNIVLNIGIKLCNKFEGSHPVVYGQLFIVLAPSLHNIYNQIIIIVGYI